MSLLIWASWGCALGLSVPAEAIPCRIHGSSHLPVVRVFPGWVSAFISPSTLDAELCLQRGGPRNTGCWGFATWVTHLWCQRDVRVSESLSSSSTSSLLDCHDSIESTRSCFCTWLSCSAQYHFMCCVWGDGSTLQPGKRWHWVMPCNGSDCQKSVVPLITAF